VTGETPGQADEPPRQGLLDTNILVLRRWIAPMELPDEMAISAVTLAELSAGPHQVRPNSEQDLYDEYEERARRTEALQRAAIAEELPLYSTNPGDYAGLEKLLRIVPVSRPALPPEQKSGPALAPGISSTLSS
jgi:hypothetical protein